MNHIDDNHRLQALIATQDGDGLDAARGIAWGLLMAALLAVVGGAVVAFMGVR